MKKKVLTMFVTLLSANAIYAQNFKDFISDVNYNVSVGLSYSQCDKEYDQQKFGISFGIDAQKPILHFPNDASTIYGLVGLHLDKKGGKDTNDFLESFADEDASISATHLKLPVRAGFSYQFSKLSLFVDLGPYFSFKVSGGNNSHVETSSTELGFGGTMGVKFKRFAIAMGIDHGLSNFATTKDEDKIKMKNTTSHIDLRWTLGH